MTRRLFFGLVGGTSGAILATLSTYEPKHASAREKINNSGLIVKRWLQDNGVSLEGSESLDKLYCGPIIHSKSFGPVEILEEG